MHPEQDKGPCSPSTLPQDPLGGMRIVDHLRGEVEAHRRPPREVVTGPARIAAGGEGVGSGRRTSNGGAYPGLGAVGPKCSASRTPSQGAMGCGGRKRCWPQGGAA